MYLNSMNKRKDKLYFPYNYGCRNNTFYFTNVLPQKFCTMYCTICVHFKICCVTFN